MDSFSRYVYEGRGWKLLVVLNTILSNSVSDLPFLREEEGKEFVDLLISLYQVSFNYSILLKVWLLYSRAKLFSALCLSSCLEWEILRP